MKSAALAFVVTTLATTVASSNECIELVDAEGIQLDDTNLDNSLISITFDSIDPEWFNQGTEFLETVIGWVYGYAILAIYGLIMTWHLRGGRFIPASELGNIPGDSFGGLLLCWALKSFPVALLALLLLLGDFSQTIALNGLTFPVLRTRGPNDTTLSLATENRNSQRLPQTAGDPVSLRTAAIPNVFFEAGLERTAEYRSAQELISGFMNAVDLVARGSSPLTDSRLLDRVISTKSYFGVNTSYATSNDSTPVVSIDMSIPLTCSSNTMISINQTQDAHGTTKREYQSLVPNCTFSQVRKSGIYHKTMDKVQILEVASSEVEDRQNFFLSDGENSFREFNTTLEFRELARDKTEWTKGRDVSNLIKGVQYGEKYFPLKSAVLASGAQDVPDLANGGTNIVVVPVKSYTVVGELENGCPERPSGGSLEYSNGIPISCLAILTLRCGAFSEDVASTKLEGKPPVTYWLFFRKEEPTCSFDWFNLVWGRNFEVDDELVAVVAGVYGRVRPVEFGSSLDSLNFMWHSIPAALLALSTLDILPSVKLEVRPRINGLFIFFMLLPLMVAAALFLAAWLARKKLAPVPKDALDILLLARNDAQVSQSDMKNFKLEREESQDNELSLRFTPVAPPTEDDLWTRFRKPVSNDSSGAMPESAFPAPSHCESTSPVAQLPGESFLYDSGPVDPIGRLCEESVIEATGRGEVFKA